MKYVSILLGLLTAVAGCAEDPPAREAESETGANTKVLATTLPPIDDFLCGTSSYSRFPHELAVQYPASDVTKAWSYLNNKHPERCWTYSLLTIGLIGTEAEIPDLIDYVVSPTHALSDERYGSYLYAPTAVGALVGRGGGDHTVGLQFLLDCSATSYWVGTSAVQAADGTNTTAAARKLAMVCIEALGLTRSATAKSKLSQIKGDTQLHAHLRGSAITALNDYTRIQDNETLLAPYFLP